MFGNPDIHQHDIRDYPGLHTSFALLCPTARPQRSVQPPGKAVANCRCLGAYMNMCMYLHLHMHDAYIHIYIYMCIYMPVCNVCMYFLYVCMYVWM